MRNYIIKRLLIMIPTFFGITIVVFTIVNLAKASERLRSQQMGETTEAAGETNESLMYFKQEFHLDKPILFNTRFLLDKQDIEETLSKIYISSFYEHSSVQTYPKESNSALQNEEPIKISDLRQIREDLVDYGKDILLILFEIVNDYHALAQQTYNQLSDGAKKLVKQTPMLFKDNSSLNSIVKKSDLSDADIDLLKTYVQQHVWRNLAASFMKLNAQDIPESYDTSSKGSDAEFQRQKNWVIFKGNLLIKNQMAISQGMDEDEITNRIKLWAKWFAKKTPELDKNLFENIEMFLFETRFAHFWGRILKLDFGISIHTRKRVFPELLSRMQYSLSIALTSTILAYLLSIPLGIFSAVKQNTIGDRILTIILFIMYSLPSFFAATVLQYYLATTQGWQSFLGMVGSSPPMPLSGFHSEFDVWITLNSVERLKDLLWHLTLPIACMTYASLAVLSRYARSGILDEIRSDYVRTARAKGLSERVVIWKHVVRNGIIPIITLLGQILPVIIGGSVIIEVIFGIDGMGRWMFNSIVNNDFNVVMTVSMISAVLTLVGILISDLMYAVVDPRISFD